MKKEEIKQESKKEKNRKPKIDKTKLVARILAGLLALMMVIAGAYTLIYYLVVE